jgi:putative FmdB family regulatory protein
MPIYEYECEDCGRITSALVMKAEEEEDVRCEACDSDSLVRIMSRFALHRSESDRLNDFDTSKQYGDDFYKDDRNIGMWAKKRTKELGVDMGSDLDEIVDKARSGKVLDDYEPGL